MTENDKNLDLDELARLRGAPTKDDKALAVSDLIVRRGYAARDYIRRSASSECYWQVASLIDEIVRIVGGPALTAENPFDSSRADWPLPDDVEIARTAAPSVSGGRGAEEK